MVNEKYRNTGCVYDRAIEECSELIQAITKAKRFGLYNKHPDTGIANRESIFAEIYDVEMVVSELMDTVMYAPSSIYFTDGGGI